MRRPTNTSSNKFVGLALSLLWFSMLSRVSRAFLLPSAALRSSAVITIASSSRYPFLQQQSHLQNLHMSTDNNNTPSTSSTTELRKGGVASPEELREFVAKAGSRLLVVDVRNPDASVEPGDQKSLAVAPLPGNGVRPQAVHLIYDRNTKTMPLPNVEKDTPIITHCGGGGRGQKAKDLLMEHGFTTVLNGGGPKETECWAEFGDK